MADTEEYIELNRDNLKFCSDVIDKSGVNINMCWQCMTCTNGCPVAHAMDIKPNVIVRLAGMGQKKKLLESSAIWLCVGCNSCSVRCPNGIDMAALNDTLRKTAIDEKAPIPQPDIFRFHKEVLRSIRMHGRTHKLGVMFRYKLYKRDWFRDMVVGTRMMLKNKLSILPSAVSKKSEIRNIFNKRKGA